MILYFSKSTSYACSLASLFVYNGWAWYQRQGESLYSSKNSVVIFLSISVNWRVAFGRVFVIPRSCPDRGGTRTDEQVFRRVRPISVGQTADTSEIALYPFLKWIRRGRHMWNPTAVLVSYCLVVRSCWVIDARKCGSGDRFWCFICKIALLHVGTWVGNAQFYLTEQN